MSGAVQAVHAERCQPEEINPFENLTGMKVALRV